MRITGKRGAFRVRTSRGEITAEEFQRIRDVPNLGSNAAFAATEPTDRDACERGAAQAADLRGMGFELGLSPVLDVLIDPRNLAIGDRAYGRTPDRQRAFVLGEVNGRSSEGVEVAGSGVTS